MIAQYRPLPLNGNKRGFTLIELLVVIAIIAILASILFPVFAKARDNARRTTCLSNCKQIGIGLTEYVQDYDEMLPTCTGYVVGDAWDETPAAALNVYIKSPQVWVCPSRQRGAPDPSVTHKLSYGFNLYGFMKDIAHGTNYSKLDNVAGLVELCESYYPYLDNYWQPTSYPNYLGTDQAGGSNWRMQSMTQKHMATLVFLYADGHAKASRPSTVKWSAFADDFNSADSCDAWSWRTPAMTCDTPISQPQWDDM